MPWAKFGIYILMLKTKKFSYDFALRTDAVNLALSDTFVGKYSRCPVQSSKNNVISP